MNEDKEENSYMGVDATEREEEEVAKEEEKKLLDFSVTALNGTEAVQPFC